ERHARAAILPYDRLYHQVSCRCAFSSCSSQTPVATLVPALGTGKSPPGRRRRTPTGAARFTGQPRVSGPADQLLDVVGGEPPQYFWMHGGLHTGQSGSLRFKPAHGTDERADVGHPVHHAVQGGRVATGTRGER